MTDFPELPQLPDDDELENIGRALENADPADMSVLDGALLSEMRGLTPEQTKMVEDALEGDLEDLTPEALDQIEAVAPGLGQYLRRMRQFLQTGMVDVDIISNMPGDIAEASGFETGPSWLKNIELDDDDDE